MTTTALAACTCEHCGKPAAIMIAMERADARFHKNADKRPWFLCGRCWADGLSRPKSAA